MRNLVLLLIGIVVLSSCKDEGEVQLNFRPMFQDEVLQLNKEFALGDLNLKFENLAFYLTDVALVNKDDEVVELAEVEFVQLNDNPEQGFQMKYSGIPEGTYKKMRFNIGVTEDLNKTTPSDYSVESPLGRSDHYWEAWGSYIFSKTEGSADPDGDGIYDLKWFYHTGSDALLRTLELNEDIVVDPNSTMEIELSLDYDKLLRNADGTPFDIEEMPRNHDPNKLDLIIRLVDNYASALSVKI